MVPPAPGLAPILAISTGALATLPKRQLQALLAHEIGHVRRKHVRLYMILDFISRWSFLGESFLRAYAKEGQVMELQADAFAVEFLESSGSNRDDLVDLLTIIEKHKLFHFFNRKADSSLGFIRSSLVDWLPPQLREDLQSYKSQSWPRKISIALRTVHFFYFEGSFKYYTYLPFDVRIKMIRQFSKPA